MRKLECTKCGGTSFDLFKWNIKFKILICKDCYTTIKVPHKIGPKGVPGGK